MPVLAATRISGNCAIIAVPLVTAFSIPSTMKLKYFSLIGTTILFLYLGFKLSVCPIARTICGGMYHPLLAMIAAKLANCSGVAPISPCPIATETIPSAFQFLVPFNLL